ncbi:MAG: TetR/AcrR family transcriptional regulator [Desulfocucumaceae bacterium]
MEKQDRLNEIYRAALKVFGVYGFKKATVEDIARELNLTKGALYQYVSNKKDLYEKAVAYGMLQWQSRVVEAISDQDDVEKQFHIMCFKAFEYLSEDSDFKRVLIKDPDIFPIYFSQDPYQEINSGSMNLLKGILEKGIRENRFRKVNVEIVTRLMFSIYKMFIIEAYILGEESPQLVFDELIGLIAGGLFIKR